MVKSVLRIQLYFVNLNKSYVRATKNISINIILSNIPYSNLEIYSDSLRMLVLRNLTKNCFYYFLKQKLNSTLFILCFYNKKVSK